MSFLAINSRQMDARTRLLTKPWKGGEGLDYLGAIVLLERDVQITTLERIERA